VEYIRGMQYNSIPNWKRAFRMIYASNSASDPASDAAGDAAFNTAWSVSNEWPDNHYPAILEAYHDYLSEGSPRMTVEEYGNCVYNAQVLSKPLAQILAEASLYKDKRLA